MHYFYPYTNERTQFFDKILNLYKNKEHANQLTMGGKGKKKEKTNLLTTHKATWVYPKC